MKYNITLFLLFAPMLMRAQSKTEFVKDSVGRFIELPATTISSSKWYRDQQNLTGRIITTKTPSQYQVGAQDLPYVVGFMSGVVVSSDAGTGTGYTDIKVRGTDLTRINVTLNGVPVNDPESQATYFVNTPDLLSSTTQIELQKGVGNSKNGTANFGASLSIHNLDLNQNQAGASYSVDFGSFKTLRNSLKLYTGPVHGKFKSMIRLSSIYSDGYVDRSSADLKSAQVAASYSFNPQTKITFNYLKGKEKTGQAWNGVSADSLKTNRRYNELGLKSDGTFYSNQTDNYGQDYYQLFVDHELNSTWKIGSTLFYTKGKGYYEEYKLQQAYTDYGLSNPILGNDTITNTDLVRQLWLDNDFMGGRLYLNYLGKKLEAGLFLNYNYYKGRHFGNVIWSEYPMAQGYPWYRLHANKQDINVYGMAAYSLNNQLKLFGDLQVRQVNYNLYGFRKNPQIEHHLSYLFFSPKVKLNGRWEHHQLTLSAGIAQKEPNRDDIEANAKDLPRPEKLFDTELEYIYSPNNFWQFFVTAYNMQYRDQLVLTGKINDVGAYTRTNIASSFRRGLEMEVWLRGLKWVEVKANLTLSSNKILNFTEYLDDYDQGIQVEKRYTKTDISFSPSLIAGGMLSFYPLAFASTHKFNRLSMDLLPKYVGKQYLDNTSNEARQLSSYHVVDLFIQLPLAYSLNRKVTFKMGIYNLLNTAYEARGYTYSYIYGAQQNTFNYYFPQAGIRYMLGAQLDL